VQLWSDRPLLGDEFEGADVGSGSVPQVQAAVKQSAAALMTSRESYSRCTSYS